MYFDLIYIKFLFKSFFIGLFGRYLLGFCCVFGIILGIRGFYYGRRTVVRVLMFRVLGGEKVGIRSRGCRCWVWG